MAVGLTPKHIFEYALNELSSERFLTLAHETALSLQWKVSFVSGEGILAYTDNGVFSWNAEVKIKIEGAVAKIQSASVGSEIMDLGRNKRNVEGFVSAFESVQKKLSSEEIDVKFELLKPQFSVDEKGVLNLDPASSKDSIKNFFSVFVPSEEFSITPILLDANILIFVLMAIDGVNIFLPDNQSLLDWGANFKPMTLEGGWWRLLTNCFLHIGIVHLLFNMYALLYVGVLLEPLLGKIRFASVYLLTGIAASVASLWWHDLTISAGASGAIFGLYGVFFALLTTNVIEKSAREALLPSISIFIVYNLVNGLRGGIDNAAHIGGLISGLVFGYALLPSIKKPADEKFTWVTVGFLTLLTFVSSFVIYHKLPNNMGEYELKMKEFVEREAIAMEVYQLTGDTPKEKLLAEIKDKGISSWKENIKLIDSFKDVDLPLAVRTRNRLLREYCELRIASLELLYKAVAEDTDQYKEQIQQLEWQVESKITEITGKQTEE
ncbi:MAG: rhomboid family intramembrane serine protease [Cyclobacteriaceae bacterium]|nr:rhomboid family intramembrane serine protease [Cyclobacteriaceae bacterium]